MDVVIEQFTDVTRENTSEKKLGKKLKTNKQTKKTIPFKAMVRL